MKKLFALLLAFCMLLTLAACGAGDTAPESAGGQEGGTSSGEVSLLTAEERAKEFITVATGPTSGVYYPIGGAFATALGAWGYKTSAEATNATGANIQLILDGDAEIAIAMQDAVMQAYTATGAYEGSAAADSLRALMRLWPNYVQLVTTSNTGIHSVEDLRGKRVGVGAANSGVEINARMILAAYRRAIKEAALENPIVKGNYQTADNPAFEVFYLEDPHGVIADFSGNPPYEF